MIGRALTLAGGLSGAVGLSQFPEFSQQYLQRMGGAVEELQVVVSGFDATATLAGMTRQEALEQVQGNLVTDELRNTLSSQINRYERLNADYTALKDASPLERLIQPWRFRDEALMSSTWSDFRPAMPATIDGLISAFIGYLMGFGILRGLIAFVARLFRRPTKA